jgi:hypothetical protein
MIDSGLFKAQLASKATERWPVSVATAANPFKAFVSMSFQLIPPPKPPFPEAINLLFHFSGKKRPKLKDESGDETTLIETAQSAGRPVSFAGNAGLGWLKEPLAGTEVAKLTVAFEVRSALKAESVHSNACVDTGLRPTINERKDWARIVKFDE